MSKYIDAVGLKIKLGKRLSDDERRIMEIVKETIDGMPTIDIKETIHREKEQAYYKGYEDGRKSIEVSEDCISREWLVKALDNLDWYDFDMFYKVVENAPSIVPTTEQYSMVGEWIDNQNGIDR